MVGRRALAPPALGSPVGYSHGMQVDQLVFVAGQIGGQAREDGRHDVVEGGLVPQFEKALENVLAVVQAAGGGPTHIVDMTIYVTDIQAYRDQRQALGRAWKTVMGDHYPAMALVQVNALFEPEAVVEIQATAAVDQEA